MFRTSSTLLGLHSHLIVVILISVLITLSAEGQIPGERTSVTTITSNVDEVSLDLVVRNKKNKPVLDLKPEDISVLDGGIPVRISDLHMVSGQSIVDRPITFVFDQLDSAGASNARNLATKILKEIPSDGFSVSVLNVRSRLTLYQGFTRDRSLLARAIVLATQADQEKAQQATESEEKKVLARIRTGNDETGVKLGPEQRGLAQVTLAALEQSQRIIQEQHTSPSLAALLGLARSAQRLPGRKVVIYFSQGLRLSLGAEQTLAAIIGTANRSSVSLFTIDANSMSEQAAQGMVAMTAMGTAMHANAANQAGFQQAANGPATTGAESAPIHALGDLSTPGMQSMINSQYDRFETRGANQPKGPLAQVAMSTSAAYIAAGENPRKAMQQMIKDLLTYYEASYVPPIQDYDGQFRPVTVKPLRSDLRIRAKSGYYALPADEQSGIRAFEGPLLKILDGQELPQKLKFHSGILQLGELTTGYVNTLVIEVPVSELATDDDPNSNLYSLHVSIVAQIKDKTGQVIEHFSEDVPRHGALGAKQEAAHSEVVTLQRHFVADPGEYTFEAAVLDQNSGKAGVARSTFSISPKIARPFLSDIALVRHMDPVSEESYDFEPLRYGNSKIVPNLSGHVVRGEKSVSLFSIIHVGAQMKEQPRLEMTVLRNNEPLAQTPLQLRAQNGADALPYLASIQSASLPPGEYQILETLTQGNEVAERSVTFRIDGPELASAASSEGTTATLSDPKDDLDIAGVSNPASLDKIRGLVIRALPPASVQIPSPDEIQAIVSAGRKQALSYSKSLPNFVCLEVTNRSVDPSNNGNWKRRDSFAEVLRYVDSQETRTMVEHNGERASVQRTDLDSTWPLSVGEFGGLLNLVFHPNSKTEFHWKEADALGSSVVDVLNFRVAHENATLSLNDGNKSVGAGFHGLVYIDKATGGVRRITLQADDLPRDFAIHAATMTVDYDYVSIGAHDYLMPMRATISLQRGRRQTDLNEMAFRNYRRYASRAKITFTP